MQHAPPIPLLIPLAHPRLSTPITPRLHTFSPATQDTHYTDVKGNMHAPHLTHSSTHLPHLFPHFLHPTQDTHYTDEKGCMRAPELTLSSTHLSHLFPNFFHPTQDTHYTDEKGNVRVRLNSHKMRWRMRRGPDGRELRESNARFVRWSDGSLQLLVGNEVLDVQQQDISHSNYYLFVVRGILQVSRG